MVSAEIDQERTAYWCPDNVPKSEAEAERFAYRIVRAAEGSMYMTQKRYLLFSIPHPPYLHNPVTSTAHITVRVCAHYVRMIATVVHDVGDRT